MRTNSLLKKGLVVGIIVLLGVNILPLTSGSLSEKTNVKEKLNPGSLSDSRGFNVSITGTTGKNGWYVSNVVITFTADNGSGGVPIYYKLHTEDPWIEIPSSPITVSTDGYYELWVECVDSEGQWYVYGPYPFKIDKTVPAIIEFTCRPLNCCKTKWLLNATVADATSGVALVEFYIDDFLVGNATAFPYTYVYEGKGKKADAIVYDNAGNSAMTIQVSQFIPALNNLQILILFIIQLFQQMIEQYNQLKR